MKKRPDKNELNSVVTIRGVRSGCIVAPVNGCIPIVFPYWYNTIPTKRQFYTMPVSVTRYYSKTSNPNSLISSKHRYPLMIDYMPNGPFSWQIHCTSVSQTGSNTVPKRSSDDCKFKTHLSSLYTISYVYMLYACGKLNRNVLVTRLYSTKLNLARQRLQHPESRMLNRPSSSMSKWARSATNGPRRICYWTCRVSIN